MKTNFLKLTLLALVILTASCDKDDDDNNNQAQVSAVVTKKYSNLYAPQTGGQGQPVGGEFTKFSFSEGAVVTTDKWDIAFRGTTILVNGGAKVGITDEPDRTGVAAVSIVSGTFSGVTAFPVANTFAQDAANSVYAIPTGSDKGWYNYNSSNNLITPIAGKVFVVKTHDGKYAKFEILSYYKDAPASPTAALEARYFTFSYAYQANSTTTF